jgi:hypothetical protein
VLPIVSPVAVDYCDEQRNSQRGTGGSGSSFEDVEGSFHPSLVCIRSIDREWSTSRDSAGTIGCLLMLPRVVIHKDKGSNRRDMICEK